MFNSTLSRGAGVAVCAFLAVIALSNCANATVFASSYVPSLTSGLVAGYDNPNAALGPPTGINSLSIGAPTVLSPFNPAWEPTDIVEIGPTGQLTLQFPNFVKVGGGSEIGVVSNNLFIDATGFGDNLNTASVFGSGVTGGGRAQVLVSNDGVNFHSIGTYTFDRPANFYQDITDPYQSTAGNVPADFGIPFTHPISDFNGLNFAQTLALFGTSGGGTWLDLASSGLSQIDYIQFKVPAGVNEFVVDAVSVNNNDLGAAVPEPSGWAMIMVSIACWIRMRRRE